MLNNNGIALTQKIGNNNYLTHQYGNYCWMVENSLEGTPAFTNGLVKWYANRMKNNACPSGSGWSVPTLANYTELFNSISDKRNDPYWSPKVLSVGTYHYQSNNGNPHVWMFAAGEFSGNYRHWMLTAETTNEKHSFYDANNILSWQYGMFHLAEVYLRNDIDYLYIRIPYDISLNGGNAYDIASPIRCVKYNKIN